MKKLTSLAILAALLVTTNFASASVNPQVELTSNLPANSTALAADEDTWIAVSFTMPPTYTPQGGGTAVAGQKLNFLGIDVGLQRENHPVTSTYAFRLFNNIAPVATPPNPTYTLGKPGQVIGLFSMPKFEQPASLTLGTSAQGTFTLNSFSTVILTPGYSYWVVFSSTTPITSTNLLGWVFSTSASTGLPNAVLNTGASQIMISQDQGKTWTTAAGATTPVTLPSGAPSVKVRVVAL